MNIVLYGVPAATAGRIADRYGLKLINSPDKFDASGTMVLVPSISAPRYLLAFYNAMLRYCTPKGKFFTLNGDLDEEELESELCQLFDSLFAEGNQINL